jgi:hypothetical protein
MLNYFSSIIFTSILPLRRLTIVRDCILVAMKKFNSSRPKNKNDSKLSKTVRRSRQVTQKILSSVVANVASGNPNGTLYTPTLPAQGTTSLTRTGDSIDISLIQYRMYFLNIMNNDAIRIIVLQAKANNVPTLASVLDTGPSSAIDVNSFINFYANEKEFVILKDTHFSVCYEGGNGCVVKVDNIVPRIKTVNFQLGTTVAETGQIYIIVLSTSGVDVEYSIEQRLIYHDL